MIALSHISYDRLFEELIEAISNVQRFVAYKNSYLNLVRSTRENVILLIILMVIRIV